MDTETTPQDKNSLKVSILHTFTLRKFQGGVARDPARSQPSDNGGGRFPDFGPFHGLKLEFPVGV